uniref:Uncharacterized protein n=1 Tax=Arundo donax TaxID=35708 RepID=A0A0A9ED85_ARUDO
MHAEFSFISDPLAYLIVLVTLVAKYLDFSSQIRQSLLVEAIGRNTSTFSLLCNSH